MTPEKQRIAIAEACGWTESKLGWWSHPTIPCNGGAEPEPPDYLNDLNAMHEAENGLGPLQQSNYSKYVADLVGIDDNNDTIYWEYYALIHSTAAQRAEAFLKTLGKWEEAP